MALPDRSEVVVPLLIEKHADERGDANAVVWDDGTTWNWQEARDEMWKGADALARLGVDRGDRVLLLAPNSLDWLRAWWGINALGATMVPLNPLYRGDMLRHIVADAAARIVIADESLRQDIGKIPEAPPLVDLMELAKGDGTPVHLDPPLEPWDIYTVNYTSGTTGPSKGSLTTYLLTVKVAWDGFIAPLDATSDDVYFVPLPLFHLGGQVLACSAIAAGATMALVPAFSGARYWDDVRRMGATITQILGTMAPFLEAQPARHDDADNPFRAVWCTPPPPDPEAFKQRFGIPLMKSGFGMTEVGLMMMTDGDTPTPTAGRPRPGVEARLVDEHDIPVPKGERGELVVRTDDPWELSLGYLNRPESTVELWRNGWLHTGDIFVELDSGEFQFVDRRKDTLRRRGENISSFEVEREVNAHPDVAEAACVAAAGDYGDEEVKVFVVPAPDSTIDFEAITHFLVDRMPHFMVPRYLEVIEELPKTPTLRVKKFELRARGNSDATWDRVAAGIEVKRPS